MIIALATVSVLFGSLLYSNLAFGASGSSGSWGTIRFFEPNETSEDEGVWKDAATFTWTPNDSTNNAMLSGCFYFEYKHENLDGYVYFRFQVISGDQVSIIEPDGNQFWAESTWNYNWTCMQDLRIIDRDTPVFPNQPNYTIKFQIKCDSGYPTAYVRNINIIVTVADGMVPNEYYKVELPSEGVGGFWIPVDKFSLLAPYIALVSTIVLAISISVAYIKYKKKQ